MSILVVIDMQPEYPAARDLGLQARIRNLIRRHDGPVCVVEYEGNTKTYPGILRACRGKRLFRCTKEIDDGGSLVVGAAYGEGLGRHRHFRLCGVNTGYCVLNTAQGILHARRDAVVTVLAPCCGNVNDGRVREPTHAALHVWHNEDDYRPRGRPRRRFVAWR